MEIGIGAAIGLIIGAIVSFFAGQTLLKRA